MKVSCLYCVYLCLAFCEGLTIQSSVVLRKKGNTTSDNSLENKDLNETSILTSCPRQFGKEGIFNISLPGLEPFPVVCDAKIAGAGWTVIASRSNVNLNFFRNWTDYKKGFGDISGDFFIGLDKLHSITKSQTHELYIHLEDFDGVTRFAQYDDFYIENENVSYQMTKLGTFTGDAGDSLTHHKGQKFSTYDRDNDSHSSKNCALERLGGWWYNDCAYSNLFGNYYTGQYDGSMAEKGIYWHYFRGMSYSYKTMKMMVRPKCGC
ncbi:ficolin-1-like [Drosophila willistoni]|uniref:ficolin-1-like n=1 Tax=Drosophila willistoni TaxID=7260 RepID=UPI001F0812FD|nr:ficolin-1-like [Drosophila willistoni]